MKFDDLTAKKYSPSASALDAFREAAKPVNPHEAVMHYRPFFGDSKAFFAQMGALLAPWTPVDGTHSLPSAIPICGLPSVSGGSNSLPIPQPPVDVTRSLPSIIPGCGFPPVVSGADTLGKGAGVTLLPYLVNPHGLSRNPRDFVENLPYVPSNKAPEVVLLSESAKAVQENPSTSQVAQSQPSLAQFAEATLNQINQEYRSPAVRTQSV